MTRMQDGGSIFISARSVNRPGAVIPDEVKARLFSRSLKMPGDKGLGLYVFIMLAENLHGQVCVEDRVPGDHTKSVRC